MLSIWDQAHFVGAHIFSLTDFSGETEEVDANLNDEEEFVEEFGKEQN